MLPISIPRLDVMQHTSPIPRMHGQKGFKELWLSHWCGCLSTTLLNKNHSPNTPRHAPWLRAGQKDWHRSRGVKDLTNMRTAESWLTSFSFKPWSLWYVFFSLTSTLALTSDSSSSWSKIFCVFLLMQSKDEQHVLFPKLHHQMTRKGLPVQLLFLLLCAIHCISFKEKWFGLLCK